MIFRFDIVLYILLYYSDLIYYSIEYHTIVKNNKSTFSRILFIHFNYDVI